MLKFAAALAGGNALRLCSEDPCAVKTLDGARQAPRSSTRNDGARRQSGGPSARSGDEAMTTASSSPRDAPRDVPAAAGPLAGHPRARHDRRRARPARDADPRRLRRRDHQGRKPGRRHDARRQRLAPSGHGLDLPRPQPQQALALSRSAPAGSRRGAAPHRAELRRAGAQHARRSDRAARLRL